MRAGPREQLKDGRESTADTGTALRIKRRDAASHHHSSSTDFVMRFTPALTSVSRSATNGAKSEIN